MALAGRVINSWWALKIIKSDTQLLDMMWNEQMKKPHELAAAKHLGDLITSISMHLSDKLHQCNRRSVYPPKPSPPETNANAWDSQLRTTRTRLRKSWKSGNAVWLKIFSKDDLGASRHDLENGDMRRGDRTTQLDETLTRGDAQSLSERLSEARLRAQLMREGAESLSERLGDVGEDVMLTLIGCRSLPRSIDRKSKVVSYDQLYVQAMLLNDILQVPRP
jgi:hypothetical protein